MTGGQQRKVNAHVGHGRRDDAGFGGHGRDDRHPSGDDPHLGSTPDGGPDPSTPDDDWDAKLRDVLPDRLAGRQDDLPAVFDLLYVPTVRLVSARPRFRKVDPQMVADAVSDALTEYVRKPHGYGPATGVSLDRHLARAAERNVLNLLRSDTRRRRREQRAAEAAAAAHASDSVELQSSAGNASSEEVAARADRERRRLHALLPDPADRRVLWTCNWPASGGRPRSPRRWASATCRWPSSGPW
jgi:hypothetical protein